MMGAPAMLGSATVTRPVSVHTGAIFTYFAPTGPHLFVGATCVAPMNMVVILGFPTSTAVSNIRHCLMWIESLM